MPASTRPPGRAELVFAVVAAEVLTLSVTFDCEMPFVNVTELEDNEHDPGEGIPVQERSTVPVKP